MAQPLRRDREFRRYFVARMVSGAGSMVTYVALPVLVYQVTGSNLWTGFVAVSEALPYLCFGLVAGAVADLFDRRRLMVGADLGSAAALGSIPVAYALGVLTAPHVLAAAFAAQTLYVFFDSANFGALPALAGRERLAAANSAVYGGGTAIEVTVPAVAGALLVLIAPAPLVALDAVSFVASALLVRGVLRPFHGGETATRGDLVGDIREGLRFLLGNRLVRTTTLIAGLSNAAAAAFLGQLIPWMDQVLGVRPGGDPRFGLMWMVMGLGGLAGSVVFPPISRRFGEGLVAAVALPASVLCVIGCAVLSQWLAAALMVGLWYLAFMVVALTAITLRQKITPDRLLAFGLAWPAGALLGGVLSEAYGPRAAAWAAVAVLAFTTLVAWSSARLAAPHPAAPHPASPHLAEGLADAAQIAPAPLVGRAEADEDQPADAHGQPPWQLVPVAGQLVEGHDREHERADDDRRLPATGRAEHQHEDPAGTQE